MTDLTVGGPVGSQAFRMQDSHPSSSCAMASCHERMRQPCVLVGQPIYKWRTLQSRFSTIAERGRSDEIAFFRHGQTKYNERKLVSGQHDTVLSDQGRREAKILRRALPPHLDLIVSSALARAVETMRLSVPAGVGARTPTVIDARLNEVHLGRLQGRKSAFVQAFADGNINWSPPGGESYREAARRVLSAVVDLFDALASVDPPPRKAAVFCHAGVMRIIATLIDRTGESRNVFRVSAKNLECLSVSAQNVEFPTFWMSGGGGGDDKHDSFEDS